MVNVERLRTTMKEHGISIMLAAKTIGVNPSTLYRRFKRKTVYFSVSDVEALATLLNLDFNGVQEIFFDEFLAQTQRTRG